MEAKLLESLSLRPDSKLLDAGCGIGNVALYMAKNGAHRVEGIDITQHHITKAKRIVQSAGLSDRISVQVGDYHNLEIFNDASFDGVYTMDTVVHAENPQ